jgi:hypothetical protein
MYLHAQQSTEAHSVVTSSKFRPRILSGGVRDKGQIMLATRSSAQGLHAKCEGKFQHCRCMDKPS